jgi:hypothetical protein
MQAEVGMPPDPQVHTHVLLPMARRHDGRVVAINSAALCYGRAEIEAVYHAALATQLADVGFAIDRRTGRGKRYFEVSGVPESLREEWSSRDREIAGNHADLIAQFRAKYGRDPDGNELRELGVRQRVAKGRSYPDPGTFWREVGRAHGMTAATVDGLRREDRPSLANRHGEAVAGLLAEDGLTAEQAVFDTRTLRIAALQHAAGLLSVAETEKTIAGLTKRGEVVELEVDRWTTREMLALEARVLAWRERRRDMAPPPPSTSPQRWRALRVVQRDRNVTLTGEQLNAFQAMLGNQFTAVTGEAGVGKGVVLHAAAEVWRAQHRRVFAVAVAGATAQRLAADLGDGAQAMTLAGLITRLQHGRLQLRPEDVIAIDEAGMIGTRQWGQFTAAVGDLTTVVAIGDAGQLSALSASGIWPLLALGGPRLSGIRRSQLAWERDAWRELRGGDAAAALARYAEHGHLDVTATRSEALTAAVAAWDADGRTGLIITDASNAERYRANQQAQQRRITCGAERRRAHRARRIRRDRPTQERPGHLSSPVAPRSRRPPSGERHHRPDRRCRLRCCDGHCTDR